MSRPNHINTSRRPNANQYTTTAALCALIDDQYAVKIYYISAYDSQEIPHYTIVDMAKGCGNYAVCHSSRYNHNLNSNN